MTADPGGRGRLSMAATMSALRALRRLKTNPEVIVPRLAQQFAERAGVQEFETPLRLEHLADSFTVARQGPPRRRTTSARPRIAWLVLPPRLGSGGHTTFFRMVQAAAEAGFSNTVLMYNRHRSDLNEYAANIKASWPWLECEVAEVGDEIAGFDACVASSWATAHILATRGDANVRRLYFIQDYEPYFFPRGTTYAFAEDSYRFGFRNIALGQMVHDCIEREIGIGSDVVPYGCDTETYHLIDPQRHREGVAAYVRRGNDRRGFRLAMLVLEEFHRLHPGVPIHIYGDRVDDTPFPAISHGTLSPRELNDLYNTVVAGLALSFTNITLVAEELLAAGAIAVANDNLFAKQVLASPYVRWAGSTPAALAQALSSAITNPDRDAEAAAAATSVEGRSWRATGDAVVRIIREEIGLGQATQA
jgi:glycosyltransferase involved in cell wall biosynthesis